MNIKSKLEGVFHRHEEVSKLLIDPEVFSDMGNYKLLTKEFSDLEKVSIVGKEYLQAQESKKEYIEIIQANEDAEFTGMAKLELETVVTQIEKLEEKLKQLLVPKDPQDDRNAVLEIRAGTGGDEACLFASDLFRMYSRYCEKHNLKLELLDHSDGPAGGFKEIIVNVIGPGAYGIFKFEAGVHRVQRVPATETQGRTHTSAATVIVMPEADEVEVAIRKDELRIDTFCSSGPGGQSVNTTYSAIRITHLPTGLVAQCQDEKSQHKNLERAMAVLRSRIYEMEMDKKRAEEGEMRKSMVSSGDRSNKIRTYNFPQNRVTDHRIDLTLYNLDNIIAGEIEELVEALTFEENRSILEREA